MEHGSAAHPENSPSELVEHMDALGNVVGLVSRQEMRAKALWHRSVFIAVMSHDGDLLVHQRSHSKDLWPGWWDVSVGGVLAPGEDPVVGALRELREELGVSGVTVETIGTGAYEDKDVRVLASLFICRTEGPFTYADGEIQQAHWVKPVELNNWLSAKDFLPDSVALVLPFLGLS